MTNHVQMRPGGRSEKPVPCRIVRAFRLFLALAATVLAVAELPAQPVNDAFASAIALTGSRGSTNGDTFAATMEAGEPRYMTVGSQSVWYTWVAPAGGLTTFEANVKSSDAVVVVYQGGALNSLFSLTPALESVASVATFFATEGTTYRIAVIGGFNPIFPGPFTLNWHQGAVPETLSSTNRFAGEFKFSVSRYEVGEFDSSAAPFGPPSPAIPFRSPDGAVVTVQRVGGTTGKVLVDYRTVDEFPQNYIATLIMDLTVDRLTNGTVITFSNSGPVTGFLTNAFTRVSNAIPFVDFTNWISTINVCGTEDSCLLTNTLQNCVDMATVWACPDLDYTPVPQSTILSTGTLVFADFETAKRFIVPVSSSNFPGSGTNGVGTKSIRVELFNQRLAPEEIINDTGIIPPVRTKTGSIAAIDMIETLPLFGGFNFFIERTRYAVDEDAGSVIVDIIQPSGSGGRVIVHVTGSENETLPWSPSGGSDYASAGPNIFTEPLYTDGTTGFVGAQDFTSQDTVLVFQVFQTRGRITIQLSDDDEVEFHEDIYVWLEGIPIPNNPQPSGNVDARVTDLYQEQPAGALDREWNPDDVSTTTPRFNPSPGANNVVRATAVQADDRTIIGGDFTAYNSFPANRIARMDTSGAYDPTFNIGTGADEFVAALAIYPGVGGPNDGKIVVGGGFTSFNNIQRNGIARLNTDGTLDMTFDPGFGVNGVVRSVAIQSDGKIVIAGEFSQVDGENRFNIARLNTDGSVDASFDPGLGSDGVIWSVAIVETPTLKIYAGGEFLDFNGSFRGNIVRLNADGSVDSSFEPGGGADGPVYAVAAMNDGRVVVGGFFEQFDFLPRARITRLLNNGLQDPSFTPGSGPNDAVYSIVVQADGKLMIGGLFTSYNGTRRVGLARLFTNGTVDTSFLDTAYNQFAGIVNDFAFEPPNFVNALALQ